MNPHIVELLKYGMVGIATTVLNLFVFYMFSNIMHFSWIVGNFIAWILSVLFAFYMNKRYVFCQRRYTYEKQEFIRFILLRVISLILETVMLYIMINIFMCSQDDSKLCSNILIIIINYAFCKWLIF